MNLHFTATFSDSDLAALLAKNAASLRPLTELTGKFTPAGVVIAGSYPTFLVAASVSTLWTAAVAGSALRLRLKDVSVVGVPLPGPLVRGKILQAITDGIAGAPGCSVEGDEVVLDVAAMLAALGMDSAVRLAGVRVGDGTAALEA